MQIKYLRIVSVFLLIAMIASFTNSPALPQGKGLQKYNPGVGVDDMWFIKGELYHTLFYDTDLTVKAGTWITMYMLYYEIISDLSQIDSVATEIRDNLIPNSEWSFLFDGYDFTAGFLAGAQLDHPIYFDIGFGFYVLYFIFEYYVNPQSIGCHSFYSYVQDYTGWINEKAGSICWLPASYF